MCKALDYTSDIFDNIERVRLDWEELRSKQSLVDRKIQDIEHYIELSSDLNASQGYEMYKMLREVLRERREIKDQQEELRPIWNEVKQFKKLNRQRMGSIIEKTKQANRRNLDENENRAYNVRVLKDVFGKKIV